MSKLIDSELQFLINAEQDRERNELEMIASENYVSKSVMAAMSNIFTNKYSEGYPGSRYYGGQENVDKLELLTQSRALKMFGLFKKKLPEVDSKNFLDEAYRQLGNLQRAVNVQPLSGSPANLAVYLGVLKPKDIVLGMDLSAGGHLSHGHPLNASGAYYKFVSYGVNRETHMIDYEEVLQKAIEHKPKMILIGFSAYSRSIQRKKFHDIALKIEKVHKYRPLLMADIAHIAGLVVANVLESPFPFCDIVTTTTHKTLRGPRGGLIFTRRFDEKGEKTIRRNNFDYDLSRAINRGVFPGVQGGPHVHTYVSKSVAFEEATKAEFRNYCEEVVKNAQQFATEMMDFGRPVITGGTDNHIILIDVTQKKHSESIKGKKKGGVVPKFSVTNMHSTGLTGKIAEKVLEKIGISVNKNMIPFDSRSPMDPSGIRFGTPALTSRGMGRKEVTMIAEIINKALSNFEDDALLTKLSNEIKVLCKKFPIPSI